MQDVKTALLSFIDLHAVWPPEMETERQNRNQWQAKLGWRRNDIPSAYCWTDFN